MLASCGNTREANHIKSQLEAPIPSLKQEYTVLSVKNPEDSSVFKLSSGTILEIPAGAFIDADGNAVKGNVSLKYKEYKDAADILASGIPMEYDSLGIAQVLQTAGMFELFGFDSTNNPVFIHPDKNVTVKMLSPISSPDYNFYVFDTINSNWKYVNKSSVSNEDPHAMVKNSILPLGPIAPQQYDPNGLVIDLKIDYSEFSELKSMKGLMWQCVGVNDNKEVKRIQQQLKKNWNSIQLDLKDQEKSLFTLNLKDDLNDLNILVTPVLSGKSYDRAKKEYAKKYEAYKAKYAVELAKLEEENLSRQVIYRTVGIGSFGIYNHDRVFSNSNPRIAASFELEDGTKITNSTVYHLYGGAATVIKYPEKKWNSFAFTKEGGNCLVVFLDNGTSAVFTNNDFKKVDADKVKAEGQYTFRLKSSASQSIDSDALRAMLKL